MTTEAWPDWWGGNKILSANNFVCCLCIRVWWECRLNLSPNTELLSIVNGARRAMCSSNASKSWKSTFFLLALPHVCELTTGQGLQHWHWPWPGQTVNGSDCHHGPRPGGTCPNNKDRNMEEVSSQQIPTATTEHVSNSIYGVIVTAQLYIVTLNFSCRDMQWRTHGISFAALTSRDVLRVSDTRDHISYWWWLNAHCPLWISMSCRLLQQWGIEWSWNNSLKSNE